MKYADEQRIQKIIDYSQKLYEYVEKENITKDDLIKEYSLQWLATTPLYNIENMFTICQRNLRKSIAKFPGQ